MPKPTEGETREHFVSRCISMRHSENPKEDNKQSIAICFSMWKEHNKKSKAAKEENK